jgi:hypothetical protein
LSLPYPLDYYRKLLEEASGLFLLLLAVAILVLVLLIATLCVAVLYLPPRRTECETVLLDRSRAGLPGRKA